MKSVLQDIPTKSYFTDQPTTHNIAESKRIWNDLLIALKTEQKFEFISIPICSRKQNYDDEGYYDRMKYLNAEKHVVALLKAKCASEMLKSCGYVLSVDENEQKLHCLPQNIEAKLKKLQTM